MIDESDKDGSGAIDFQVTNQSIYKLSPNQSIFVAQPIDFQVINQSISRCQSYQTSRFPGDPPIIFQMVKTPSRLISR